LGPWTLRWWRLSGWLLVVLLLLDIILGWYWSREPEAAQPVLEASAPPGQAMPRALVFIASTLLEKPGGYLGNDLMPHRLWLDNMPGWEYGVLQQVRLFTGMLRYELGRPLDTQEDADLAIAHSQLNFDHQSWAMPSTESEYQRGIQALRRYVQRLGADDRDSSVFNAGADHFDHWLASQQQHLQALSRRLQRSVAQLDRRTRQPGASGERGAALVDERTPRLKVDDVFYESRGAVWALLHLLYAARVDFAPLLDEADAAALMTRLLQELEFAQTPVGSPVILNGSGFGILANHSLVLAGYLTRAEVSIRELRALLGS